MHLLAGNAWKATWATFVLAGYLVTLALVSSPSLHAAVHPDAGHENHPCAVMTLLNEQVVTFTPTLFIPAKFQFSEIARYEQPRATFLGSSFLSSNILEHAPPSWVVA